MNFRVYFFREEWDECVPDWQLMDNPFNGEECFVNEDRTELTVEVMEREFPHFLAYLCRQAVLDKRPFLLDRPTIRLFGLTREDVKWLQEPIARCNERIIEELRQQYNRLAAIDALREGNKKTRKKSKADVAK